MKILVLGCGNMGAGLAVRLSSNNEIFLYDRNAEKVNLLVKDGYGSPCHNLPETLKAVDAVILAIKPKDLRETATLVGELDSHQILISVLAGTPVSLFKKYFSKCLLVRMMPNLATLYGEGLIGLTTDDHLPKKGIEAINRLCEPLGKVYWLDEVQMDAFTSLTSSGPAFLFSIFQAMVEAGKEMGFTKNSDEMVLHMIKGSLVLMEKSGQSLTELKRKIASPGGVTEAGLKYFEEHSVRNRIINTFLAAREKAFQMGGN